MTPGGWIVTEALTGSSQGNVLALVMALVLALVPALIEGELNA